MDTFVREGWKKLVAGIVMLAVIRLIDSLIASNAVALVVEIAVGFTVYCVMILVLRDTFISEIVMGKILKRGKKA
jgi:hypothetical protein